MSDHKQVSATECMSDSLAGSTVLIVDDDEDLREIYESYLDDRYETRTAADGKTALDLMDDDVDVVLLDRMMPGMSGDEVLREIRLKEYDALVVMLTGVEPDFDIVDMAFDDYLIKPVSQAQLNSTVEEMLTRAKFYDEELRERLKMAAKRSVLQAEKSDAEREKSEKYQELKRELGSVHQRVDDALSRAEGDPNN